MRIVRIVVNRCHRSLQIEILDQHTLLVKIGDSQRTNDTCHSHALAILLYSGKQRLSHLRIVHELNQSKTDILFLPTLVSTMVDNSSDATNGRCSLIRNKGLDIRNLQPCILFRIENLSHVHLKVRNVVLAVLIMLTRKMNEIVHDLP